MKDQDVDEAHGKSEGICCTFTAITRTTEGIILTDTVIQPLLPAGRVS